jgi:hypothetical protein
VVQAGDAARRGGHRIEPALGQEGGLRLRCSRGEPGREFENNAEPALCQPVFVSARDLPALADLDRLYGKYEVININLDKAGGLTEAIALAAEAKPRGFRIMVGGMIGTSLGIAPALLIAQQAEIVDLDGPLLLASDRVPGLPYDGSTIHPLDPNFWG